VGAVAFEPVFSGKVAVDTPFNRPVRFQTQARHIQGSTLLWWLDQPGAVRERVLQPALVSEKTRDELPIVLSDLGIWLQHHQIQHVWAGPAAFDLGILRDAFAGCGMSLPWSHRVERDTRTLWAQKAARADHVARRCEQLFGNLGVIEHDALHDAIVQALEVQDALRTIEALG
jgi:hypothetical protein